MNRKQAELSPELEVLADMAPVVCGLLLSVITYFIFHNAAFSIAVAIAGVGTSLYFVLNHLSKQAQAAEKQSSSSEYWRSVYNMRQTQANIVELYPSGQTLTSVENHVVRPKRASLTAVPHADPNLHATGSR